ncbi:MAG: RNA polymerase sigma-70 factor [Tannerellaceae bacterium]|jgi:RNA polymerase sigma-70 factor (ECF subfamily)|nr:RNA polymerase sigma-70 factor [Tannerellaceae bacterium]
MERRYHIDPSYDEDELEDIRLFTSIRHGDVKAFDMLFLKYYPRLCAYASQFVAQNDTEEVVQDMMMWFWENRAMQVYEVSLKRYLFKAVKNRCLTLINRNELKERVVTVVSQEMEEIYDDPDIYEVEELTRRIESALQALPENYRKAFELNRFHDLSYKEIAQQLNTSPKTIDYRIQKALKILRGKLREYLHVLLFLH